MAIEQMKLLSITGKDADLEKLLAQNLLKCNIQIEDAKKIYEKGWKLEYYEYDYRVKEYLKKCNNLIQKFNIEYEDSSNQRFINLSLEEIESKLSDIQDKYETNLEKIKNVKEKNSELQSFIEPIKRLKKLDVEARKLYDCKYLKFRYGNVPSENLTEIKKEIEDLDVVLFELEKEDDVTWIIYFTTEEFVGSVDGFFNMQKFARSKLPAEIQGKPFEYIIKCNQDIKDNENKINLYEISNKEHINDSELVLISIYRQLETYEMINNLKKYIAKDPNGNFYIVVWVPKNEMKTIMNMLNNFPRIEFVIKDAKKDMKAPTKLKNFSIFRPFESIVKMYGVPNVQEIDPTTFIAIVTCLLFGIMFGDVGQGAVILCAGVAMILRQSKVGWILVDGGIFSVIFGFLYGSVFGKENIVKPILVSPMENINTMLISGIVVGSILIVIAMLLNIINGLKSKNYKKAFLESNGLAGFIMYVLVAGVVGYYFLKGSFIIPINIVIAVVIIMMILILFNDKILNLVSRKKEKVESSFIEKIFEIIEMILSFLSNTISFLRLAAFAINHAGLCMAVYLLAEMASGTGNLLIAILGNIVVIVLEGLIVGIQVLRLEYYELFSRFYEGNGREYKSIEVQAKN